MSTNGPESSVAEGKDRTKWEEEMKAVVYENERQMKGEPVKTLN